MSKYKNKKKKAFPYKTIFVVIAIILILGWIIIPNFMTLFNLL